MDPRLFEIIRGLAIVADLKICLTNIRFGKSRETLNYTKQKFYSDFIDINTDYKNF